MFEVILWKMSCGCTNFHFHRKILGSAPNKHVFLHWRTKFVIPCISAALQWLADMLFCHDNFFFRMISASTIWLLHLTMLQVWSLVVSHVLFLEMYSVYVILSAFPVWYGLYYESHYRPHAFYTSFISVNHIRLHATCSCYLVLMVTGVVMRGEMREWWMVIVVLLLLNVWPGTILLVPRSALVGCLGLLRVYSEMSVYCCLRPVVMKTNSQGWVFVCWSPGISCSILI